MSTLPRPAISGNLVSDPALRDILAAPAENPAPIGYLVHVDQYGFSANPQEEGVTVEFWCPECARPCSGDPVQGDCIPVHRVNIGIYSQVCDVYGRLVVDGVKTARNGKDPLCLFGKTA